MDDAEKTNGHVIDRDKLHGDFPTQFQEPAFWEELGRTVAAFGFIEGELAKAIYALTGAKEFDPKGDPEAFNAWIKTLEKALTDQLGVLIITYEKALTENPRTKEHDFSRLIAELKEAKEIRNALCHGSWGKPDDQGRTVPKFVRRDLQIFETPVDVAFFKQTRAALREIICDILDSVTMVGYKFPGSDSPGEQLWPDPATVTVN
ncbi:MAG: hypothetical protein V4460_05960 [Pseudomonadota bacterium]|jgi:hypothetical protein